jgi:hypothetical protein
MRRIRHVAKKGDNEIFVGGWPKQEEGARWFGGRSVGPYRYIGKTNKEDEFFYYNIHSVRKLKRGKY